MKRLLLLLSILFHNAWSINLKLLKGTSTIVPSEYSPVSGISNSEWKLSEQWYRMSPKYQLSEFETMLQDHPDALQNNPELAKFATTLKARTNNATENLIMSMYNVVAGSFVPTNAQNNPIRQLQAHHIGQILKLIKDSVHGLDDHDDVTKQKEATKSDVNAKLSSLTKENYDLSRKVPSLTQSLKKITDLAEKEKIEAQIQGYQQRMNAIKLENKHYQELQKTTSIQDPQEYVYSKLRLNLLNLLNSFAFKNDKGELLKWNQFVDGIIGGLKESIGDQKSYPENTVQAILLGYLLDKSTTRDDLQDYFKAFLGDASFKLPSEEYSSEEIEEILKKTVNTSDFAQFADFFTAYTFTEKYNSNFPKIVDNNQIVYKGNAFADCIENTLRMLTNIVTYNKSQGEVGVVPEGMKLSDLAHNFYTSSKINTEASEVGNNKVHQAWVNVVENMSGSVYANIGNGKNHISNIHQNIAGFMPVDSEFESMPSGKIKIDGIEYDPYKIEISGVKYTVAQKVVGDTTYILIPKKSDLFCFELAAINLNIVTGLNHIFDLNLYSHINDLFNPDFVSENFEKICQSFGWKIDLNDMAKLDDLSSLDIPIENDNGKFTIKMTHQRHGYVSVENSVESKDTIEVSNSTKQDILVPLAAADLQITGTVDESLKMNLYKVASILDPRKRYFVVLEMLKTFNALSDSGKSYLKSLIINFSSIPEGDYLIHVVDVLLRDVKSFEQFINFSEILGLLYAHDLQFNSGIIFKFFPLFYEANLLNTVQVLQMFKDNIDKLLSSLNTNEDEDEDEDEDDIKIDPMDILSDIAKKTDLSTNELELLSYIFEKGILDNASTDSQNKMLDLLNNLVTTNPSVTQDTVPVMLPLLTKIFNQADMHIKYSLYSIFDYLAAQDKLSEDAIWQLLNAMQVSKDLLFKSLSISLINHLVSKNMLDSQKASKIIDLLTSLSSFINDAANSSEMSPEMLPAIFDQILTIVQQLVDKNMITLDQFINLEKNIPTDILESQKEKIDAMKNELSKPQDVTTIEGSDNQDDRIEHENNQEDKIHQDIERRNQLRQKDIIKEGIDHDDVHHDQFEVRFR